MSFDANFHANVSLIVLHQSQLEGQNKVRLWPKVPFLNFAYQSQADLSAMAPSPYKTQMSRAAFAALEP